MHTTHVDIAMLMHVSDSDSFRKDVGPCIELGHPLRVLGKHHTLDTEGEIDESF